VLFSWLDWDFNCLEECFDVFIFELIW
jgi:hypothetical protein